MLVLTRKNNESIMIGSHIKISIIQCEEGKVKLGIEAPKNIKIHREEIFNTIIEENKKANQILPSTLPQLKNL